MTELHQWIAGRSPGATGERGASPGRGMISTKQLAIVLTLSLGAAAMLAGCEPGDKPGPEYMPDMARGPGYKAFAPNAATRNGITLQRPVAGTIKRGFRPFHYGKGEAEATRAGVELTSPFHATEATIAKGKALYEIYCLVCHGEQGKGDGPISSKIPPPPSYKSERLLAYPPGRIFHVITMGANKMPSYAVQLVPEERWLVITYVRSQLQGLPEAPPGIGEGASAGSGSETTAPETAAPAASAPAPAPAASAPAASAPAVPAPAAPMSAPAAPRPAPAAPRPAAPATPASGSAPAAGSVPTPAAAPAPPPAAGPGGRP
jgi:mono/diheme cytochrome c family protein